MQVLRKAVAGIGGQGEGPQSGEGTVMWQQCRLVSTRELMKATTDTHYKATPPKGQMGEESIGDIQHRLQRVSCATWGGFRTKYRGILINSVEEREVPYNIKRERKLQ